VQRRARVLDLLHREQHPTSIAETLGLSLPTVFNIKRRYLEEGFDSALQDKPRSGQPPRILGEARARITALACSKAPEGHARWTLRLLADRAVKLGFIDSISHHAVKQILKKTVSDRT
jgi:transposase